jgi:Family of unknown function (DUF6502)
MIEPPSKRIRSSKGTAKGTTKGTAAGAEPAPVAAGASAAALDPQALTQAMRQLLEPLAVLAIARGVPFATVEQLLKTAFVDAARAAHPDVQGHRTVSRISTATGINRREVARITQTRSEPPPERHSPATRVFTKWLADPTLKARNGEAMALPRNGPAPSFEALAQSVTRDVHPRSLLDELRRLGLARVEGDTVHAVRDAIVPRGDSSRMLGFLANNVGDHLRAAVVNVLSEAPPHLEQAVFADDLSQLSLDAFRKLMRTQWKTLLEATVPTLQNLIDADRDAGRPQDQRVRVGLYTYAEPMVMSADSESGAKVNTEKVNGEKANNERRAKTPARIRSGTRQAAAKSTEKR